MKNRQHEQILARYYSEFLEDTIDETLWALVIDAKKGLYQVNNIPFYGPEFANGDIIHATFDNKLGILCYQKIVEHSGHSTIQVAQAKETFSLEPLAKKIGQLGGYVESLDSTFFVIDVAPNKSYGQIYKELLLLEKSGEIAFAEPVLTEKHLKESHRNQI